MTPPAPPGVGQGGAVARLFLDTLHGDARHFRKREGEAIAGAAPRNRGARRRCRRTRSTCAFAVDRAWRQARKRSSPIPHSPATPAFLQDAILAADRHRAWGSRRVPASSACRPWQWRRGKGRNHPDRGRNERSRGTAHKGQELTLCLVGEFSDSRATSRPRGFLRSPMPRSATSPSPTTRARSTRSPSLMRA